MDDMLSSEIDFKEWANSMEIDIGSIDSDLCNTEKIKNTPKEYYSDEHQNKLEIYDSVNKDKLEIDDSINNDIELNEVQINLLDVTGFKERNQYIVFQIKDQLRGQTEKDIKKTPSNSPKKQSKGPLKQDIIYSYYIKNQLSGFAYSNKFEITNDQFNNLYRQQIHFELYQRKNKNNILIASQISGLQTLQDNHSLKESITFKKKNYAQTTSLIIRIHSAVKSKILPVNTIEEENIIKEENTIEEENMIQKDKENITKNQNTTQKEHDLFNCLTDQITNEKIGSFDGNIFFVGNKENILTNTSTEFKDNECIECTEVGNIIQENNNKDKVGNKMKENKADVQINEELKKENNFSEETLNTTDDIDVDNILNKMIENSENTLLNDNDESDNDNNDQAIIFTGIININLIEGKDFPFYNEDTTLYLYIKLKLCNQIQKTLLIKDNLNTEQNETFQFSWDGKGLLHVSAQNSTNMIKEQKIGFNKIDLKELSILNNEKTELWLDLNKKSDIEAKLHINIEYISID